MNLTPRQSCATVAIGLSFLTLGLGTGLGATWALNHAEKRYAKLVQDRADEQAAVLRKAVQQTKAQGDLSQANAVREAEAQERIVYRTKTIVKEVPHYVTASQDAVACVSYGLVRLLDAAATGRDPADLELPAGQSNDACSPVKASDLARSVAENYGTARQNAHQLDSLQEDIRRRVDLANGG